MLILKIYLIITWLLGIATGLYGKKHWDRINNDGTYDMFNPDVIISFIVILFPIILPIIIIFELFIDKNDN